MRTPLILSALGLMVLTPAFAANTAIKEKSAKPASAPGWVVLEEDWYYPLRYEPSHFFHNARMHYRRSEEKSAANEIDKAVSWLNFAAGHSYPETQKSLNEAAKELKTLAADLRSGKTAAAARVDQSIAKAEHALASWHYFKAKNSLAKDELKWAAIDLQSAASYLKNAASSAHYEFGSDNIVLFDSLDKEGSMLLEGNVKVPHSTLEQHLKAVNAELTKMANVLKKDAA